ncbi:MAG: M61 family metallopeptidase [Gammaproteobacteria bacterium]|nr:M61 family metallopeptidase [Gammaproteobacteria bacterium]
MNIVHYSVELHDATSHLIQVKLTLSKVTKGQVFRLPNWIPGSYMLREFARHIVAITANGRRDLLQKIDGNSWQLTEEAQELVIEYRVYAYDMSVRGAHLDDSHLFFNGTSVFLEPVDFAVDQFQVTVTKPSQIFAQNWRLATSMKRKDGQLNYEFGEFIAHDYDELIDHPFEMGELDIAEFKAGGVLHALVLVGEHQGDLDRICKDLSAVCAHQIEYFGELPECVERYLFMVHVLDNGYGGLEHRSSTALHCSYSEIIPREQPKNDDYLNFLTLCSHEYFHTWNIKQIKPAQFLPYQLDRESYTKQLWIFEGFTSYHEDLLLLHAGVITQPEYLKLLSTTVSRVYRGQGRHLQSVAESSFDAWTRFYKQDENAPNAIVSYYAKGKLVALCLDLLLRQASNNAYSIQDVMQYLWQHFGKPQVGLGEGQLEQILAQQFDFENPEFFASAVYGTDDLPLETLLQLAGYKITWSCPESLKHLANESAVSVNFGASVVAAEGGIKVLSVLEQSNAYHLGICAGDIIIALNGRQIGIGQFEARFSNFLPEETVTLHLFRRQKLKQVSGQIQASKKTNAWIEPCDQTSAKIAWL